MASLDLFASTSYVETPFIIATIGGYSFGVYNAETKNIINKIKEIPSILINYPNFVDSLVVKKINGALNTYTLKLTYAITKGDDPNLIDKVLSKAKNDRTIKLSYGDLSIPTFIYKEEEAFITQVKNTIDVNNSSITYILSCTSKALNLNTGNLSFKKAHMKPSDRIKEILYSGTYGLLDIFYGMRNRDVVLRRNLIASDDIAVDIEAKTNVSIIDYLKYLVSCMTSIEDSSRNVVNKRKYLLMVYDDVSSNYNGPYFSVTKIDTTANERNNSDIYEVNIGYPGQNIVTNFSVNDDETYSLLYDFSESINQSKYEYRINNNGEIESFYSPNITNSDVLYKTTAAERNWWTQVTQFPISATLTIKGLLKPVILMTYIKINVWFYGRKHISSGVYMITEQEDTINSSGYRTRLSLTRVGSVSETI